LGDKIERAAGLLESCAELEEEAFALLLTAV
jgi:hypothetical protein